MVLRSLRKDQHAVRADVKRTAEGVTVVLPRFGGHIGAPITFEVFAVTLPVAVETKLPGPRGREADDVTILRLVKEVSDDHDVVRRAALVPTVVGEELAFVVQVKDSGELPAETAGEAVAVEPQPDEVAVQPNDAVELVALVPIDGDRVAEIISLEEFLALEEHGDARRCEHHGRSQGRALLRVPALRILGVHLLRHARTAVCHLVVRFAVDDPFEGVVVVAMAERIADGDHRAMLILVGDHRLTDGVNEFSVPLRAESSSACPDILGEPLVVL